MKDNFTRNLTLGGMFEQSGNICTHIYLPLFFLQKYPEYKTTYAVVNALVLGLCGFLSNFIFGMIGDKFEKNNPRIKSRIAMFSALLTLPIMILELGNHGSYWVS